MANSPTEKRSTVLVLKCLNELKQVAMVFYRKLLAATSNIGLKRSSADPCLYFKWAEGQLIIMISWIDDNMILGPSDLVMQVKEDLMKQFDCDDCGRLEEYVGNKIEYVSNDAIRFVQTVLMQSYSDKFELGKRCYNTPAQPGRGSDEASQRQQTIEQQGAVNIEVRHCSRPDISQAAQDLAHHMTRGDQTHMEAMLRCMQYLRGTKDVGLLLKPERKWDGNDSFLFKITGISDSDYAKDTQTMRSITGYVVYIKGVPVMHQSATQKTVALSLCEAELNAAVLCVQDMIYGKNLLESIGLKVKLSMVLQITNKGAVDLINSFSVGGRTRHIDVKQCFL